MHFFANKNVMCKKCIQCQFCHSTAALSSNVAKVANVALAMPSLSHPITFPCIIDTCFAPQHVILSLPWDNDLAIGVQKRRTISDQ